MDRNWNLGLNIKRWVSPGRYKCLGYLREMKKSRDENIKKQRYCKNHPRLLQSPGTTA